MGSRELIQERYPFAQLGLAAVPAGCKFFLTRRSVLSGFTPVPLRGGLLATVHSLISVYCGRSSQDPHNPDAGPNRGSPAPMRG